MAKVKNHPDLNREISDEFLVDPKHPDTFRSPKLHGDFDLRTLTRESAQRLVDLKHPGISKIPKEPDKG